MLYIALALAGLLPAARVILRRRDAALLATAVMAAAFIHMADWVASGVLGLYKYHPGLVSDIGLDDALGVVLAELTFVTALAVLLIAYIPAWWGALIGSAIVTALEYWFTRVGALEPVGWRLWYTTGGFVIYFLLVRRYWLWVRQRGALAKGPQIFERITLALTFNGIFEILLWATKAATSSITLMSSPEKNQALMRLVWHLGLFVPLCYWVLAGTQLTRQQRLLAALGLSITIQQILVMTGLRTFSPPWNPVLHGLVQMAFVAAAGLVDDRIRLWARHAA